MNEVMNERVTKAKVLLKSPVPHNNSEISIDILSPRNADSDSRKVSRSSSPSSSDDSEIDLDKRPNPNEKVRDNPSTESHSTGTSQTFSGLDHSKSTIPSSVTSERKSTEIKIMVGKGSTW